MQKVVGFIMMNSIRSVDWQRERITAWAEENRYQIRAFRGSFVSALCAANRGDVIAVYDTDISVHCLNAAHKKKTAVAIIPPD